MKILLTNDDGFSFVGLTKLKTILSKYGDVTVVAPESAMSGMSVAIIYGRPVRIREVEHKVYAMEGTPADCVAFGLSSLGEKFDVVISGCNDGFNICMDSMYSGTVGAALQALTYRVPAIAMSCDEFAYDTIDAFVPEIMDYVIKHNLLSKNRLLNVNIPNVSHIKGIKITRPYFRKETTYYVPVDKDKYLAKRDIEDEKCTNKNTDAWAVYHGYVSISYLKKIN